MWRRFQTWSPARRALSVLGLALSAGALAAAVAPSDSVAWAKDKNALESLKFSPESIPNAVGLFISPRGQKYLRDNLEDVLYRNGLGISDAYFPEYVYQAPAPILLDNLPPEKQGFTHSMAAMANAFSHWLIGFDLQPPQPTLKVKDIEYWASFSRLGVRTDLKNQKSAGIDRGVGIILEAELPELAVQAKSVRGFDPANEFLGEIGINGLRAAIADGSAPLRFQLPFVVEIDRKRGLRVQSLGAKTNISDVKLAMDFERPLVLPEIELRINKRSMKLNPSAVEEELIRQRPAILGALQNYLQNFAEKELPSKINQLITQGLAGGVQEINEMDPPGLAVVKPGDKFRWGIKPEEIALTEQHLYLGLSGFVEDPRSKTRIPLPQAQSKTLSAITGADPKSYDVALALNQSFINRVLQLSFQRGYFDKVEAGPGEFIHLADMPEIRMTGSEAGDTGILRLKVEQEITGFKSIFVRNPVRVDFDAKVRFKNNGKGGIKLVLESIDESTVVVDPSSVRFESLMGKVVEAAKEKLRAANAGFAKKEMVLTQRLPVPPAVAGIPLAIKGFQTSPSGHIVVFMNYALQ